MKFEEIEKILKKIYEYYIHSIPMRNFTAFLIDCGYISLMCWNVYFVIMTPVTVVNWWLIGLSLITIFLLRKLSIRLRVTRVCPACCENRGIIDSVYETGETRNYRKYIDGDYWKHEEEYECIKEIRCLYCDYGEDELFWKTKTWRGDLTEEAKIRKAAEAHEEAERRARIRAWEEIRSRNRY